MHPARTPRASVFNTGQILRGTVGLWRATGEQKWLDSAARGAEWLRAGMNDAGLWDVQDYKSASTPSYYTHVLWPMLEVEQEVGDGALRDGAERGFRSVMARARENGAIAEWSFEPTKPAFTHTIAYTLRGAQECSRLLGNNEFLPAIHAALDRLVQASELRGGRLPGAFEQDWSAKDSFICLTGNAQVAKCVLIYERAAPDLRLVSAAARMVDVVCRHQRLRHVLGGVRGGVAGSAPLRGPYMRFRYPNWAAKYFCDAIVALCARLDEEEGCRPAGS